MSNVPAVTMDELELESAELLPNRETLCCHPCCDPVWRLLDFRLCLDKRVPLNAAANLIEAPLCNGRGLHSGREAARHLAGGLPSHSPRCTHG